MTITGPLCYAQVSLFVFTLCDLEVFSPSSTSSLLLPLLFSLPTTHTSIFPQSQEHLRLTKTSAAASFQTANVLLTRILKPRQAIEIKKMASIMKISFVAALVAQGIMPGVFAKAPLCESTPSLPSQFRTSIIIKS
jgi:hypothetical protein